MSSSIATPENQFKFHQATSNISGTAEGLKRKLKQLDAGLTTCMRRFLSVNSCWLACSSPEQVWACGNRNFSSSTGHLGKEWCYGSLHVFAELKEDLKGKKEFEDYLTKLKIQKADIEDRIEKNKAWIVSQCFSIPQCGACVQDAAST
eukprot:GHUV01030518.1.p1 GENE.GHUV01030518.1~~GHUV01030518.1.p1  ORF type:complete len:148 (-),score=26.69 GHUV01030518.1:215-658(-)